MPTKLGRVAEAPLFTRDFLLILALQMTFGFAFSLFFLLPKYLVTTLSASPDAIGQVMATAMIAAVVAVPLIGRLIDRYDRRRLILYGSMASGLASLGFIPITSIGPALFMLRALQGAALALVFNAAATLVTDIAPAHRMSQALGFFGVSSLVMNAVAPALGEQVARDSGFTPVFVLGAMAAGACGAVSLFLPAPTRVSTPLQPLPPPTPVPAPATAALMSRRVVGILYAIAIVGSGFGVMFTFCLPFALSLGAREVSGFFIGFTISAALVRVILGGWVDRIGRQRVAIAALFLYGVALVATSGLRIEWLAALGALLGIAHGLIYPALNAMVVEGVEVRRRGSVMALFNGCFNAGVAASTLVFGSVAAHAGYPVIFIAAGMIALSAVVTLALVPPR